MLHNVLFHSTALLSPDLNSDTFNGSGNINDTPLKSGKKTKQTKTKQLYIMNVVSALTGLQTTYLMAGKFTDRPLY